MKSKPHGPPWPRRRDVLATGLFGVSTLASPANQSAVRPVRVLSTTDQRLIQPLVDDFERRYPSFRVEYIHLGSVEIAQRLLSAEEPAADVIWSSAMDLQIQLVNDGHAARHDSVHEAQLPRWSVWKREAFATTYEPVGFLFHRPSWPGDKWPRTHAALAAALAVEPARWRARVATYDVEQSGLGYMLAAQDERVWPEAWHLFQRLAACRATLHSQTQDMLDGVESGHTKVAYNVLGTYAEDYAQSRPDVVVVYPADYTLIVARVAFISRYAPNPNGAHLWMEHLLSPAGQAILGNECGLYPVRTDVATRRNAAVLQRHLGLSARPIVLGPGLLAQLDRSTRAAFLSRWRKEFADANA